METTDANNGTPDSAGNVPGGGPLILLAGPTATGKSELAMALASRLRGEIVSVDSMQVYRGMDIGTAKPSPAERARVPHHLVDIADITEPFDAAQFVQHAREAVNLIRARGSLPILCGGTGLYFKAFLEGVGHAPPTDPAFRRELEILPLAALLRELQERDPATFERIDRRNPRRLIRALEVIRLTGKPFADFRSQWLPGGTGLPATDEIIAWGITRKPDDLRNRINLRVDRMIRGGLVAETEAVLKRGLEQNLSAQQALGYRQVAEYLQGKRPLAETVELIKVRTRRYAKKQLTWFRRQMTFEWTTLVEDQSMEQAAGSLIQRLPQTGWPPR